MMNLSTDFSVPLPVDESWTLLQDMERVARWFPGAKLEGAEGDTFKGAVRVKLGPMVVDYRGTARFVERDEDAHRVVIEASGREQRGTGIAKALAVTTLEPGVTGTSVSVSVDLDISGRPAQLGQSLMQDVAQRIVSEFSGRMRVDLLGGDEAAPSSGTGSSDTRSPDTASSGTGSGDPASQDGDVLDLGRVVGPQLLRRAVRVGVVLVAVVVALRYRSRAGRRRGAGEPRR